MQAVIQFDQVSKKYGQNTAVNNLSFSINKGEFVTILGSSACFPHMTIADNIATVPKMLGWDKIHIEHTVRKLLYLVQLDPDQFANRYPGQLSGGQQQRVGVARALAANPPYVLFDEPFGALDALTRAQLQKGIKQIREGLSGKTFLFVTHDINEALFLG